MPPHSASPPPSIAGTPRFVGRATLLRTLQTNLPQGRSYAILAGPKTGRTSLVQQLIHLEREKARISGAAMISWVPVYLDLRAAFPARPQLLFDALWKAVKAAVLDPLMQGTDQLPAVPRVDFKLEKHPAQRFAAACEELWNNLANTRGWSRWSLLCDNAEALAERGVPRQVAEDLLTMCDAQMAHRPRSMLWVGAPPLEEMLTAGPCAALRRLPMGALRDAEAQSLYRAFGRPEMPPDAPWEVCMEASGRHPMILSALMQATLENEGAFFGHVRQACEAQVEAAFAQYLTLMGPMAEPQGDTRVVHALMQQLLLGGQDMAVAQAESLLGLRPVREAADILESFAVIERAVRGNTPTLRAANPWWNSWYGANAGG